METADIDMEKYEIFPLRERSEFIKRAAGWFSSKWNIPEREYAESMIKSLRGTTVPQWYLATAGERIVGGAGVIENDFHNRKDLAPNVCALFVEEPFRGRGVARELLSFLCADMAQKGVNTLYLLTEHTSFYERCGWEYFCTALPDGESEPLRVYVHKQTK